MSARGWCAVCRISLYLVEPSHQQPEICRECLPTLIGQDVICPVCVRRALNLNSQRLLERVVDRTLTTIDETILGRAWLMFPVCCHAVKIPKLVRTKLAMVECG